MSVAWERLATESREELAIMYAWVLSLFERGAERERGGKEEGKEKEKEKEKGWSRARRESSFLLSLEKATSRLTRRFFAQRNEKLQAVAS